MYARGPHGEKIELAPEQVEHLRAHGTVAEEWSEPAEEKTETVAPPAKRKPGRPRTKR